MQIPLNVFSLKVYIKENDIGLLLEEYFVPIFLMGILYRISESNETLKREFKRFFLICFYIQLLLVTECYSFQLLENCCGALKLTNFYQFLKLIIKKITNKVRFCI